MTKTNPYPGLRFYDVGKESFFGGRDEDGRRCIDTLKACSLLVLHGSTGCGKSSFLRASVKPKFQRITPGSAIGGLDRSGGLEVIRSTEFPLWQVWKTVLSYVRTAMSEVEGAPQLRGGKDRFMQGFSAIEHADSLAALVDSGADVPGSKTRLAALKAKTVLDVIRLIGRRMVPAPILVIDQAEEVLTLADQRRRSVASALVSHKPNNADETSSDGPAPAHDGLWPEREATEYFQFLREFAAEPPDNIKIIISMRTEYKGRFDERLELDKESVSRTKSFHLEELNEKGLETAIMKASDENQSLDGTVRNLKIDRIVAETLAKKLTRGQIPPGGQLPALQVACKRMWNQAYEMHLAKGGDEANGAVHIKAATLARIGDISRQVTEYLQEQLELVAGGLDLAGALAAGADQDGIEAIGALRRSSKRSLGDLVDDWHKVLADTLVNVEADGRAVTQARALSGSADSLISILMKRLNEAWTDNELELRDRALVASVRLLASDECGVLRIEKAGEVEFVTLGHDSLALALSPWRGQLEADEMMMMRMGMSGSKAPGALKISDLFPVEEEEQPQVTRVYLSRDYMWDRQMLHFAQARGFDKRLGIEFCDSLTPDSGYGSAIGDISAQPIVARGLRANGSDSTNEPERGEATLAPNWPELRDRLNEAETWAAARRQQLDGEGNGEQTHRVAERIMTASEFEAFPGTATAPTEETSLSVQKWSDVLSTNLFLGSTLMGQSLEIEGFESEARLNAATLVYEDTKSLLGIKGDLNFNSRDVVTGIRRNFRAIIKAIEDNNCLIAGYDGSVRSFLEGLCALAGYPKNRLERFIDEAENGVETDAGRVPLINLTGYGPDDPLIDFLLSADKEDGRKRLIIANSSARALGSQLGFRIYTDAKQFARSCGIEMSLRKSKREDCLLSRQEVPDVAEFMQRIGSHTTWQLGMPAGGWSFGLHRSFVLRLASIGYFTTDYVRGNMSEFATFIQSMLNFSVDSGESGAKLRFARSFILESLRHCYHFVKFDEYATEFYDLDSINAYWTNHSDYGAKSVAVEIYHALTDLRKRTLEHAARLADLTAWLRYRGQYDPAATRISEAFSLKEKAWNNFKIFNFYDSERLMMKAVQRLTIEVEHPEGTGKLT